MEKLAKFPHAMLAGCPILCGQMCHHCETCLRFSHRLRSAPRGRWHSGRHQLGLNSGGKTCLPHPPPPGVGTGQEAVSTSVSRLIAELSANQHSPLIGQSALPLDRPISTPPWDVCLCFVTILLVSRYWRQKQLWSCTLVSFLLFHKNKRKPEGKNHQKLLTLSTPFQNWV